MSKKKKLQRFAAMAEYPNVIEPAFEEVFRNDYRTKGRWHEVFGNDNPIVLELGCGRGEYTVALARRYPCKNFIGVDIKGARMWVGATEALNIGLVNAAFLRTRIEFIVSCFAPGEVSEIWITFPDPQPGRRRASKRLTSSPFMMRYRQILAADGLIHLKTDSDLLFDYTCRLVAHNGLPVEVSTADLYHSGFSDDILAVQTRYERLFMDKGHTIKYMRLRLPAECTLEEPAEDEECEKWATQ